MADDEIRCVGVGRGTDSVVVAIYAKSSSQQDKCRAEMQAFLNNRISQASSWRDRLPSELGTWHIVTDSESLSYFALVKAGYPDYLSNSLLDELKVAFKGQGTDSLLHCSPGAYTKIMAPDMIKLTEKYDKKRSTDRIGTLSLQVQDVQGIVGDSIQQVLRNTESAEAIGIKSQDMRNTAQVFHSDARKLERIMYWRKVKLNIIIACVVIAVILYIVVPIAVVASR
mmetsp:Transcript_31564/g.54688  ORF Transcript_31564/g.54688 Transcript_31564/m.54688 type:complete len:226 (-) Transcript_31564:66-743(-)